MQPRCWMVPVALAGIAVLTACTSTQPETGCGAVKHGKIVGAQLASVTLPERLDKRIVGPDVVVTKDLVPTRLNIWVGDDGVIARVYCG